MTHQNFAIAKAAQRTKYRKELEINALSPQVRKEQQVKTKDREYFKSKNE